MILAPVEPADAALHHRWLNDPEVTRYLTTRYPLSLAAIAERLATPDDATARFTVVADGERIGYAALRRTRHVENRSAELDLLIGERRGQGFGTAATRALAAYGFGTLGLHRVYLWVFAENAAAVRAYEKAGFVHEGVSRDRLYKHGAYHDCLLMGLLAEERQP